mgnify:CR=1 FL=1
MEASKFSTAEELERQWNDEPNKGLLDYALRIDIANVRFGLEAGWKVRASGDTQVQKGLTLFDEAAARGGPPEEAEPGPRRQDPDWRALRPSGSRGHETRTAGLRFRSLSEQALTLPDLFLRQVRGVVEDHELRAGRSRSGRPGRPVMALGVSTA